MVQVFWYGGQLISEGQLTFEAMLKVGSGPARKGSLRLPLLDMQCEFNHFHASCLSGGSD